MSILPWFSSKSTVTLSIVVCVRSLGVAATIFDVLPDNICDKGLLGLIVVFVSVSDLLMLNCFVYFVKVEEGDTSVDNFSQTSEQETKQDRDTNLSIVNSKINEVAAFTIYTDEMTIEDEKL